VPFDVREKTLQCDTDSGDAWRVGSVAVKKVDPVCNASLKVGV
jgi:hypothetical protein